MHFFFQARKYNVETFYEIYFHVPSISCFLYLRYGIFVYFEQFRDVWPKVFLTHSIQQKTYINTKNNTNTIDIEKHLHYHDTKLINTDKRLSTNERVERTKIQRRYKEITFLFSPSATTLRDGRSSPRHTLVDVI